MALKDANENGIIFDETEKLQGNGWSIPLVNEWTAFGGMIGLTASNYRSYGLKDIYWSATTNYHRDDGSFRAWYADFSNAKIDSTRTDGDDYKYYVRLCTKF